MLFQSILKRKQPAPKTDWLGQDRRLAGRTGRGRKRWPIYGYSTGRNGGGLRKAAAHLFGSSPLERHGRQSNHPTSGEALRRSHRPPPKKNTTPVEAMANRLKRRRAGRLYFSGAKQNSGPGRHHQLGPRFPQFLLSGASTKWRAERRPP